MNNLKNDVYYVDKALEQIYSINKYLKSVETLDELLLDDMRVAAIMFCLIQLIEKIKELSDEYKEKYSYIPWGKIVGFRNGIVHEYGKTDYSKVWIILQNDIPELQKLFESTLNCY